MGKDQFGELRVMLRFLASFWAQALHTTRVFFRYAMTAKSIGLKRYNATTGETAYEKTALSVRS